MKRGSILVWLALVASLIALVPPEVGAGTTGKLAGRLFDEEGDPIAAATILLVGTKLGAYSDAEGRYTILNVPAGTYEVKINRLGFESLVVQGVVISADQTTPLETALGESVIETQEVVITAERPPVDLNLTSTQSTVTAEEIETLPVQDLDDIVDLQAGVVEGHFRGGRLGEVQFQVDGVSINNPYDNSSSLKLDRSLLQEVQVISGTFDAEYGQAMSGVVNAVLKDGGQEFDWSAEAFAGAFLFPGNDARLADDTIRPGDIQNYQLNFSGPVPLVKDTVFLVSGRRYTFDDYIYGSRTFLPTDDNDLETNVFFPSGDGEEVPLGFTREWSGVVKLTNTTLDDSKISYQALVNHSEGRRNSFAFRYNPDGLSQQTTVSVAHGLDWTQTLSGSTFLDVSLRQNYFSYQDMVYDDVFDPRYDAAGRPEGARAFDLGAFVQGVELTRFEQTTDNYVLKSSVLSQVSPEHQVKVGAEIQLPQIEFGTPGHLSYSTGELERHLDDPPDWPGVETYHPLYVSGFAQDVAEMPDFIVRFGGRVDHFDARANVPSDLRNPANAIAGAPTSLLKRTTTKTVISPRLGVAYPIQDKAAIHFSYGHFHQFPSISDMFTNANYDVLANLQAGEPEKWGVLGNPDVFPEKTVQYEFGYKHALSSDLGVDVTTFYKDIRDLIGVEIVSSYTGAEYFRLTNVDFGNVFGVTVAVDHRQLGPFSLALDYTWQQSLGNSSDPRETATRAAGGEDPLPRLIPFNWDQRHTMNLTLSMGEPSRYSASAILRAASGQPYTPIIGTAGFGTGLVTNSGRKPVGLLLDLRGEKMVSAGGTTLGLFARVFNALDTRFFNGGVFNSTGSVDYSRFPAQDEIALADPTRFYPPRRIEIGIRWSPEAP